MLSSSKLRRMLNLFIIEKNLFEYKYYCSSLATQKYLELQKNFRTLNFVVFDYLSLKKSCKIIFWYNQCWISPTCFSGKRGKISYLLSAGDLASHIKLNRLIQIWILDLSTDKLLMTISCLVLHVETIQRAILHYIKILI